MRDYHVVPLFWGPTFPLAPSDRNFPATPYAPSEFTMALESIAGYGYFSQLAQYGANHVTINAPFAFNDPWPTGGDGYYVAKFTSDQVVAFIERHIHDLALPAGPVPIFAVVIPNGSLLDVHALGAHATFPFEGQSHIWFWIYGGNSISGVCGSATHEIVEAIGFDFGTKELCDDCKTKNPAGRTMDNGLTVETYFDQSTGQCVAPGSTWVAQLEGIGGGTSVGPSLAVFQNRLYAAWKGAGNDERMFWSRFDGNTWAPQLEGIGGGSSVGPSLAVFQNWLYAAWKGAGNDERMFWSRFDGNAWAPQLEGIGGGSSTGPSRWPCSRTGFSQHGKAQGGDERMFWSRFDGNTWAPQLEGIGGGSSVGPSLAAFQNQLYAAWKGVDGDDRMFWSSHS